MNEKSPSRMAVEGAGWGCEALACSSGPTLVPRAPSPASSVPGLGL